MKALAVSIVISTAIVAGCDREANDTNTPPAENRTDRDNTAVNARDRNATTMTAGQQSQSKSDVEMAAEIRRKVVDTKMSVNAQNAKIIVNAGKVTLRGPVKTQDEKDTIGRMAAEWLARPTWITSSKSKQTNNQPRSFSEWFRERPTELLTSRKLSCQKLYSASPPANRRRIGLLTI